MLKFKSAVHEEDKRRTLINYELAHVTPGRDGTHLRLNVQLKMGFGSTWAEVEGLNPEVQGEDPEKALDKLAEWLERAAKAIRSRGEAQRAIPLYKED